MTDMALPREAASDQLRRLLGAWGQYHGISLDGDRLVTDSPRTALDALNRHSADLMAASLCRCDPAWAPAMTAAMHRELAHQLLLAEAAEALFDRLAAAQIPAILLKGPAIQRFYPIDCLRPSYDVDFLIDPRHRDRGIAMLLAAGYKTIAGAPRDVSAMDRGELELKCPHTQMVVECHWDFIASASLRRRLRFDPSLVFDRCEHHCLPPHGRSFRVLDPTLLLVYVMAHHVLHHQFRGLGWLADAVLIAGSGLVQWDRLAVLARDFGLARPVHYYLHAITALGLALPAAASGALAQLRSHSPLYHGFSRLNPPRGVFAALPMDRLRCHLFRNAFKR